MPVTIDGAKGLVGVECNFAAVALDGRGYVVVLYTSGDEPDLEAYDRAWFERLADDHPPQPAGRRERIAIGRSLIGRRPSSLRLASLDGEASLLVAERLGRLRESIR